MNKLTEEDLMAFADGMLEPKLQAIVEAYIAENAEAAQFVEAMRIDRQRVARAFEHVLHEPIPARLIDAIEASRNQGSPQMQDNPVVRLSPRRPFGRALQSPVSQAMAASLVIALAGLGGYLSGRASAPSADPAILAIGDVPANSPLARMLDTKASGSTSSELGGASDARQTPFTVQVVATFRDRNGRFCREIEIGSPATGSEPSMTGVACRNPVGTWTMEGGAMLAAPAASGTPGYKPSGSSTTDALESVLQGLGVGTALSPDEEQSLLSRGWR